jgi:predicted short-subunit dehydrogenase-like oxidoreductase (DUF2520 family)
MKMNIIGGGKLGKTLAKLLNDHTNTEILGIVSSTFESAQKACKEINCGQAYPCIATLPQSDMTLIATPDNIIENVVDKVYQTLLPLNKHILFHCSGLLSSNILQNPKFTQVYVASIHPLRSFADYQLAYKQFSGTFCALEGDEYATDILNKLFLALGAIPFQLQSEQKALYHTGSVFASNYMVTLYQQAIDCFKNSGIEPEIAKQSILNLMHGTLGNIEYKTSAGEALTGPIKRGDTKTISAHIKALSSHELQSSLYHQLGRSTLPLCQHSSSITLELETLFTDD